MNKNIKYIINYAEGKLSKKRMLKFENDLLENKDLRQDYLLYMEVNEYMRGKADLEEVKNDLALHDLDELIKETISEYHQDPDKYEETEKFVKESLNERNAGRKLKDEINEIKLEIDELNINKITKAWVKEWKGKGKTNLKQDPDTEKIREYINQSIENDALLPKMEVIHKRTVEITSATKIRLIGLAAAALIAGFLIFRSLVPDESPSTLYSAFYKPMSAISPVTRGNSTLLEQYGLAIDMYNQKKYDVAASMFNEVIRKDESFIAAYFFLGITQMELDNYSEAISNLVFVLSHPQEFTKEAQWYLGLAYLKIGEKKKATLYFEILAGSNGFYQDHSKKILRKLR